jgi:hypothetical protein
LKDVFGKKAEFVAGELNKVVIPREGVKSPFSH